MPDDKLEKHVKVNRATLSLTIGDITIQTADAIVNAANPELMGGGGVDGAIHRSGGPAILAECKQIIARYGPLQTGKAVITTGGNLKARFVIHTVGPIWHGGSDNESDLLESAYRESLLLAAEHKLESIAFSSISTGVYGYPVNEAAQVAIGTVVKFLVEENTTIRRVVFVLFNHKTYDAYVAALLRACVQG